MTDNKKTTQSFQCRDSLWECFSEMARELECSVDYLINDAMKQYARQRGYGGTAGHSGQHPAVPPAAVPQPVAPVPPPGLAPDARRPLSTAPRPVAKFSGAPPPASKPGRASIAPASLQPQAPLQPPAPRPSALPPPQARAASVAPRAASLAPAPRSRQVPPPPQRSTAAPALSVYYNGERFSVNKERFIIGRGRQSSDLTIKDPNVSRQHAMIEFINGQHFIVDMGSANGLEYAGQLIQRRVINDGDVFRVCDHELRFSYG